MSETEVMVSSEAVPETLAPTPSVGRLQERRRDPETVFHVDHLSFFYGSFRALRDVSIDIGRHEITSLIGPSGCGKSTFLRCLNRMNDLIEGTRQTGEILLDGQDVYQRQLNLVALRRRVGMVFQKSNPFPKSIFENVVYGPRVAGLRDPARLAELTERCLRQAAL